MDVKIESSWKAVLQAEFDKEYFETLTAFVRNEYKTQKTFPPANLIFEFCIHCVQKNSFMKKMFLLFLDL
jgi:uracil-DNA glycosylase